MSEFEDELSEDTGLFEQPIQDVSGAYRELVARCQAAGLRVMQRDARAIISFPRGGRGQQNVVFTSDSAQTLLGHPFETLRFVGHYDAVVSYQLDTIEALVRTVRPTPGLFNLKRVFPEGQTKRESFGSCSPTMSSLQASRSSSHR